MILIYKNGFLTYKNKNYKCSLGKNGINDNKVEGDSCTPEGVFSLGSLYVRKDRIKDIKTNFNIIEITKTMAWSNNSKDKNYNSLIHTNNKHDEKFYRKDNIYDLILIIDYNINPTIPYKGSAIFIHVKKNDYEPTNGCIALHMNDLLEILSSLKSTEKIKILNN